MVEARRVSSGFETFNRRDIRHQIQTVDFFESIVYQRPRAVGFRVDFAFAVIGSAAWSVDQSLCAHGFRTNPTGLIQYAVRTGNTALLPFTSAERDSDEARIQRRKHPCRVVAFGEKLNAGAASG